MISKFVIPWETKLRSAVLCLQLHISFLTDAVICIKNGNNYLAWKNPVWTQAALGRGYTVCWSPLFWRWYLKYFPMLFTRRELRCSHSGTETSQLRCSTSTNTCHMEIVNSPTLGFRCTSEFCLKAAKTSLAIDWN